MLQINVVEKIKTHYMMNNFSENRAVHEVMWTYMVEPDWPQMTI
jgi:hypothetical protein